MKTDKITAILKEFTNNLEISLQFYQKLTLFMVKTFDVIQARFFWTLVDKRMFEFSFVRYQAFILDYRIRSMIGLVGHARKKQAL